MENCKNIKILYKLLKKLFLATNCSYGSNEDPPTPAFFF